MACDWQKKSMSPDTTMADIYKAAAPFLVCDAIAMATIILFPQIALWIPNLMG